MYPTIWVGRHYIAFVIFVNTFGNYLYNFWSNPSHGIFFSRASLATCSGFSHTLIRQFLYKVIWHFFYNFRNPSFFSEFLWQSLKEFPRQFLQFFWKKIFWLVFWYVPSELSISIISFFAMELPNMFLKNCMINFWKNSRNIIKKKMLK